MFASHFLVSPQLRLYTGMNSKSYILKILIFRVNSTVSAATLALIPCSVQYICRS